MSITPNGLAPLACASTSLAGPITRPLSGIGAGAFAESGPHAHGFGRVPDPLPAIPFALFELAGAAAETPADGIAVGTPVTGAGPCQSQLPHGYRRLSSPCAAYCHSHSC